jgi:ribonuclease HI
MIKIATDGASKDNQTPENRRAGIGFVVQINDEIVHEESRWLGQDEEFTCNVAEYKAAICAAKWLQSHSTEITDQIEFQSDSELLVKQITGEYTVNDDKLARYHSKLTKLLSGLEKVQIKRIGDTDSELVNQADTLAREGASKVVTSGSEDG